jgi:S-adenosylmethionine:tRNA ribosyltransferase-isomerase
MLLSDFDYELPTELIAQFPLPQRSASRLLVVDQTQNLSEPVFYDKYFKDIHNLLNEGDLLVFNDTKVIPARIFGIKESGGKVEILIERILTTYTVLCQIKASKPIKPLSKLLLGDTNKPIEAIVIERQTITSQDSQQETLSPFYLLDFHNDVLKVLEEIGELPLPPYIKHKANADDQSRYQTIFASNPGAVAAPTAGLHFDEQILNQLKIKGVKTTNITLHVGSGTFSPVRNEDLSTHQMHFERYVIPPSTREAIQKTQQMNKRIICVGTTSMRALESSVTLGDSGDTNLFITPGYKFQVVDALITNFHLPKSTLLMLVSAFSGLSTIKKAYQHAIEQKYRFFSYGDAMFLERFSL